MTTNIENWITEVFESVKQQQAPYAEHSMLFTVVDGSKHFQPIQVEPAEIDGYAVSALTQVQVSPIRYVQVGALGWDEQKATWSLLVQAAKNGDTWRKTVSMGGEHGKWGLQQRE